MLSQVQVGMNVLTRNGSEFWMYEVISIDHDKEQMYKEPRANVSKNLKGSFSGYLYRWENAENSYMTIHDDSKVYEESLHSVLTILGQPATIGKGRHKRWFFRDFENTQNGPSSESMF